MHDSVEYDSWLEKMRKVDDEAKVSMIKQRCLSAQLVREEVLITRAKVEKNKR